VEVLSAAKVLAAQNVGSKRAALIECSFRTQDTIIVFDPAVIVAEQNTEHLKHCIDLYIGAMIVALCDFTEEDFVDPDSHIVNSSHVREPLSKVEALRHTMTAFFTYQVCDMGLDYGSVKHELNKNLFPKDQQFQHSIVIKRAECPLLHMWCLKDSPIVRLTNGVCGTPFILKEGNDDADPVWISPVLLAVSSIPVDDPVVLRKKISKQQTYISASGLLLSPATRDMFAKGFVKWIGLNEDVETDQYKELEEILRKKGLL